MSSAPTPPKHSSVADPSKPGSSDPLSWVSALCDGDPSAANPGFEAWRQEPKAREAWHVYHLIGDVMRSDDLATQPGRDQAMLAVLRQRLANEPVPFSSAASLAAVAAAAGAPAGAQQPAQAGSQPMQVAAAGGLASSAGRLGWRAPVAVAAGFAAVATVITLLQQPSSTPGSEQAAGSLAEGARSLVPSNAAAPALPVQQAVAGAGLSVVPQQLVPRDERLAAQLREHQRARLRAMAEQPDSALRQVPVLLPPDVSAREVVVRSRLPPELRVQAQFPSHSGQGFRAGQR